MIDNKSIERLQEQIDIVDIISHYIPLKKTGSSYKCVCPFHDDKNPSMSISQQKQIYHCFACKAGGNAIKFVMEYEKISYPEAIEKIASLSNFTLEYTNNTAFKKEDKQILQKLNAFYRTKLYQNHEALAYLHKRGMNNQIIDYFELGYAPDGNSSIRLLQNENIEPNEAIEVGVIKKNENGTYASFIDRITFPIYNHVSKIVGFGGRTITNHPAKYINSPQSTIFDKSKLLYGYNLAKQSIFKQKEIIIVEGYLDVIMLHMAGISNAVAVLGTALTTKHLPLLKKEDIKVILCFDSDEAGINAAKKSSYLLSTNEIDGCVVILEEENDPADMIKNKKTSKLIQEFAKGIELGEFYIRQIALNYDVSRPTQKQKCLEEIVKYTNQLKPVVAQSYTPLVSFILQTDPSLINLSNFKNKTNFAQNKDKIPNQKRVLKDILELSILKSIVYNQESKIDILKSLKEEYFLTHKEIFKAIANQNEQNDYLIRELEFESSSMPISNTKKLDSAITNLKIKYYENLSQQYQNSHIENKLEILEKIRQIIKGLKS